MILIFRLLISIGILGVAYSAYARNHIEMKEWTDAPELAAIIPRSLLENGINKIGDLNIIDLVNKITDPKELIFINLIDLIESASIGGVWPGDKNNLERSGAECFTALGAKNTLGKFYDKLGSKRFVNINDISVLNKEMMPHQMLIVLLHESVCALYGFDSDNQYQISASMAFIFGLKNSPREVVADYLINNKWDFLEPFKNIKILSLNREKFHFNAKKRVPAEDGGVTGGHGGGDPWAPEIKFLMMNILHGQEIVCHQNGGLMVSKEISCKLFLENMNLWWKNLRSLNIQTKIFPVKLIKVDKIILPSSVYHLNEFEDSTVSLIFNSQALLSAEFRIENEDEVVSKVKMLTHYINAAFLELIVKWEKQNEKK